MRNCHFVKQHVLSKSSFAVQSFIISGVLHSDVCLYMCVCVEKKKEMLDNKYSKMRSEESFLSKILFVNISRGQVENRVV